MKIFLQALAFTPMLAVALASPATAQTTKTTVVDTPQYNGSRTVTIDREAGTVARDASVTRKSDGALATSEYDRARTETGVTASGSQTGFGGKTRSFDYTRDRTDTGSVATGTVTRGNGETLTYNGTRTRGDGSFAAEQSVTGSDGASLYNRQVTASRADGQVSRSATTTRAQGFRPGQAPRTPRLGGRRAR